MRLTLADVAAVARNRGSSRAPVSSRAWPASLHMYMYVRADAYADDSVAEQVGNTAPRLRAEGPPVGPDEGERERNREGRSIEGANSRTGSSAGPALGPTGGPGVTFQDGCA